MNRNLLIAYASSFSSFILCKKADKISKIILFGSVARNQHDEESDIDVFIDTKEDPKTIRTLQELFESSEEHKKFKLLGVKTPISLHIDNLSNRKHLKRSMIGNSILLYSEFHEAPEGKMYALFTLTSPKLSQKNKLKFWRNFYGHKQAIGGKTYLTRGLISELDGKKISKGVFMVPFDHSKKIQEHLRKHKIKHTIMEIWTDSPMLRKSP